MSRRKDTIDKMKDKIIDNKYVCACGLFHVDRIGWKPNHWRCEQGSEACNKPALCETQIMLLSSQ